VVIDFEYEVEGGEYNLKPGDLPVPLCMVAYLLDENLQHVQTIALWREQLLVAKVPPFSVDTNTAVIAYSAWAEMTCFHVLHWQFPVHVLDLHTAYLAVSNILLPHSPDEERRKPRKRLADACRAYGIEGWEHIDKQTIAEDIGQGRWQKYGRVIALHYCEEDVRRTVELLRAMLRAAGDRRFPRAALVELQRQGGCVDSGTRHADRHDAVEFGAGEQGRHHPRAGAEVRSQPRQRLPNLHARR
jgi:hypothetical protein